MTEASVDRIARVRDVFEGWADGGPAEGMAERHAPFVRPVFERLPLPPEEASEAWKASEGALVTLGRRPN